MDEHTNGNGASGAEVAEELYEATERQIAKTLAPWREAVGVLQGQMLVVQMDIERLEGISHAH